MKEKKNPRDAAADYIALRARTEAELRRRLKEKEYTQEEIEETLSFALDCGLVNDEEYSMRYTECSMRKGRGPLRIFRELSEKGVSRGLIQAALEAQFDAETEYETALKLAVKELPEDADEKDFARTARKLASRGFRSSAISRVMNGLREGNLAGETKIRYDKKKFVFKE